MFDLGWAELLFLAVLALVVVGPQDLPRLAHMLGKLWGKVQRLYRDALLQLRRLETEMDNAAQPDQRQQPNYYELLPEHVRQAMEQAEPSRDPEHNQCVQAMYQEAIAEVQAAHQNPASAEPAKPSPATS